jgi:hypothetical protein
MRATPVRWLFGLAILTIASVLSVLAPAQAHAGTCYTVSVGSDGATVCPWQ